MINIFLDDERVPSDATWMHYADDLEWVIVRTQEAFIEAFKGAVGQVGIISFDHDLQDFAANGEERTGYTCIKWLVDHCMDYDLKLPLCVFHTKNIVGRGNMDAFYQNARKHLG